MFELKQKILKSLLKEIRCSFEDMLQIDMQKFKTHHIFKKRSGESILTKEKCLEFMTSLKYQDKSNDAELSSLENEFASIILDIRDALKSKDILIDIEGKLTAYGYIRTEILEADVEKAYQNILNYTFARNL